MSQIKVTYGNDPVAESGYQNVRWQVDNSDPFNPEVSAEVPQASSTLAGILKLIGDLGGAFNSPIVVGLQGFPINPTTPTTGQFLRVISGAWKGGPLLLSDIPDLSSTYQVKSAKDAIGGYAGLDGSGLVPLSEIPALPESRITGLTTDLATLATVISTETSRAETAEAAAVTTAEGYTDTKIATEVINRNTAIAVETARAEAAEATLQPALGFTPENVANKDTTVTLGTSDTKYPSQKAVKTYVDAAVAGGGGGSGTLAGDTDVVITSPANNDVLTYESSTSKWKNKPPSGGGGGGGSSSRTTATITTSGLAPNAQATSTISLAKSFMLLIVAATVPLRLRLYSTSGAASDDASRSASSFLSSATANGCICDLTLNSTTGLTWNMSPAAFGSDDTASPTGNISYIITNDSGATQTCSVTLTYLPMET